MFFKEVRRFPETNLRETSKLEGKQNCFPEGKDIQCFFHIAIETRKKKENGLTPISIVSVGFSVAILELKPPYEIQKVMQHYFR